MQLLSKMDRQKFEPRLNGKPLKQWRRSVYMLLQHEDADSLSAFSQLLESRIPKKYSLKSEASNNLRQLLVLREDVSNFLKVLDPTWSGVGTVNKSPTEVIAQWRSAQIKGPKLLAAGTVVENLYARDEFTGEPHVWLEHKAETVDGSQQDAAVCDALFVTWVESQDRLDQTALGYENRPATGAISPIAQALDAYKNVIVEGVAGSGKTHLLNRLKEEYPGRTTVLVFHPSTSYEDFVVGLRPVGAEFVVQPGAFLWMCERATRDPDNDYLLFIDEVNRANTARVLGDLLMVIESSKRAPRGSTPSGENAVATEFWKWNPADFRSVLNDEELASRSDLESVQLQTPLGSTDRPRKHLVVPQNLHILGTMNTTDRSVGTIDLALRRRFHWRTAEVLTGQTLRTELGPERARILHDVINWHEYANALLLTEVGPDARLGHSYFFADRVDALQTAQALLGQLAEVAHTFNIGELTITRLFANQGIQMPGGLVLKQVGMGLGRRFQALLGSLEAAEAAN